MTQHHIPEDSNLQ